MAYDPKELAAMSNADAYGKPPRYVLNEVSLNGDTGKFRKRVYVGHKGEGKPEEVDLGTDIQVVFLKIRRKLVERSRKGEIVRQTNEHNHKDNVVSLWPEKISGKAGDLRTRFEGLRTVQYVYCLLLTGSGTKEPELVKLQVKGSSLGSDAKAEDVMSFYDYISSFKDDTHFFQFKTVLKSIEEKGAKTYHCIAFERGDAVSEERMETVASTMKEVHDKLAQQDEFVAKRIDSTRSAPVEALPDEQATDAIKYPDEEINPEDIPF